MQLEPKAFIPAEGETFPDVGGHFRRMAPKYDDGCGKVNWQGPVAVFEALKAEITRRHYFLAAENLRALDLGTGTGLLGELFKNAYPGTHVTGVDLAEDMLAQARTKQRIDKGILGSVTDLSWARDHSFDVATCAGVLDFIEDTESFAAEITRALKPGGLFALTFEPNGTENPGVKTLRHHPDTLRGQFERRGAHILSVTSLLPAYKNYITHAPVENAVLLGITAEAA